MRSTFVSAGLGLGLSIFLTFVSGGADASEPSSPAAKPALSKPAKAAAKKSDGKAKRGEAAKPKGGSRAGTRSRTAKQKGTGLATGSHPIAENVQLVPFPSHAEAARKAFAQNRRDHLADAEKAARAPKLDDRWQSVLFSISSLDARGDVEACFWRVLAYYRLGEVARARSIRQLCTFDSKEEASLDAEEGICGSLQPAAVMPEMLAAGERPPAPVANPAPYGGASPARIDR